MRMLKSARMDSRYASARQHWLILWLQIAAELSSAGAQIAIRTDENCKVLCRIDALSEVQAKAFRGKIEDEYRVLMYASPLFTSLQLTLSTSWLPSRLELRSCVAQDPGQPAYSHRACKGREWCASEDV